MQTSNIKEYRAFIEQQKEIAELRQFNCRLLESIDITKEAIDMFCPPDMYPSAIEWMYKKYGMKGGTI